MTSLLAHARVPFIGAVHSSGCAPACAETSCEMHHVITDVRAVIEEIARAQAWTAAILFYDGDSGIEALSLFVIFVFL